jgi:hypothetical protein
MTATNEAAMTRRGVLASAGAGASAAALGSAPAPAQTSAPKTFVLVHGAWHGGWCGAWPIFCKRAGTRCSRRR